MGLVVAVSSCADNDSEVVPTGSETEYTSQEMAFNVATRPMSRAAINGEKFPASRTVNATSIYHYADNANPGRRGFFDPWPTVNNSGTNVDEVAFSYNAKKEAWAGSPSQYWPATGSMDFAAWSTESHSPAATWAYGTSNESITGLTLDFASAPLNGTDDVLYSDIHAAVSCPQKEPVKLLMRHALAWISFVEDVRDDNDEPITAFSVSHVTVHGVNLSGKVTCAMAKTTYDTDGITVTDGSSVTLWSDKTDPVDYDITDLAEGVLLVPGDKTSCTVYYDVTIGTVTSSLSADISLNVTSLTDLLSTWEPGIHYIYTIAIRAKEITLIPTVIAWDTSDLEVKLPSF